MDNLQYKPVENDQELKEAFDIRKKVFVEEQAISETLDQDGNDPAAFHLIVNHGGRTVATARVIFLADKQAKLERMAILKPSRGAGIGRGFVSFLEKELKKRGIARIVLHAQYPVIGFYKKCGFKETGSPFLEAGIKHIRMEKDI